MAEITSPNLPRITKQTDNIVYLVEERDNPSTDFFVSPVLSHWGLKVIHCGFNELPHPSNLKQAVVIFVRYVPPAWAKLIEELRPQLDRLIFFMDDDVLDLHATTGMPWRYRFKLARLAAWRREWLRRQKAELWVSTPYLQQKYTHWRPQLILPAPIAKPSEPVRVFYHGSTSHTAEINWLRPVMTEALHQDQRLFFEIVGGIEVYRLYRDLPRITIVHPMKWPAYQAFVAMPGRHIGLAPQLELPFNRARSYTKFFDITRSGAVGIYATHSACSQVIRHGREGLVVKMEQQDWVEAILLLAENGSYRQDLLQAARKKSEELAALNRGIALTRKTDE
jgi:glycosyltransferase involved in cell wall biosynthesis